MTRRGELATARRFLLAGSAVHAAAALAALGSISHPVWAVLTPAVAFAATPNALGAMGLAGLLLAILGLMVAVGLRSHQTWAPRAAFVVAAAGLVNAPFGTLASLLTLAFLFASMEHLPQPARRKASHGLGVSRVRG